MSSQPKRPLNIQKISFYIKIFAAVLADHFGNELIKLH